MTIQTDLRNVTDRIIAARHALANAEAAATFTRYALTEDEAALAVAHRALMAHSDAGSNDAARRAYAERETTEERERAARSRHTLVNDEMDVIRAASVLRVAEDERRYLELVARLTIAGAVEVAPAPAIAYYTGPDGDPFARAEAEMEVAA